MSGENRESALYTKEQLLSEIRWDERGLVTAVVQDAANKDVLMVAHMNRESLTRTLASGTTWFWSRSRGELWNKGATSGHFQRVKWLRYDCDADALLVGVEQTGAACHTGKRSCFYRELDLAEGTSAAVNTGDDGGAAAADPANFLHVLEALIAERQRERPEGAYTTYLFEKGIDKILKKVGEEAAEVIIGAKNRNLDELRYESADLIFHLMVLWRESGLSLDDVLRELSGRHLKKKGDYPTHVD